MWKIAAAGAALALAACAQKPRVSPANVPIEQLKATPNAEAKAANRGVHQFDCEPAWEYRARARAGR